MSWRSTRRLRALLRRMHAFLVAAVLLVGIARGGARYFTCPMMGSSFAEASCCAGVRHAPHDDVPAVENPECCKARTLGTLPASPIATSPEVAAVPLAAIAPPFDVVAPRANTIAALRFMYSARAGPPSAKERRAELMVWTS
jgi:hypothetical protein